MNLLEETLSTLYPQCKLLAKTIMEGARANWERDKEIIPFGFFINDQGVQLVQVGKFDYETKPHIWKVMAELRRQHRTVMFLSEIWESRPKPGDLNPDGSFKVMPRDDPNRQEYIMLQAWEGTRLITFRAQITRNPDNLGEWEVFFDSHFPVKMGNKMPDKVYGAMMEGPCYAGEGN